MGKKPDAGYFAVLLVYILVVVGTAPVVSASASSAGATAPGPCTTELSSGVTKLMPFNTSSLKCVLAWSKMNFTLMFAQEGPSTWSFVLSAPDAGGYIAVGFSPSGAMVGSSAVAGWTMPTGAGLAHQYYLGGETSHECKPNTGSLPLVKGKTAILKSQSRLYLVFQLNATAPPQNKLVYALGPEGKFPGKDLLLTEHRTMATGTVDFQSASPAPTGSPANPAGSANATDAGGHAGLPETTSPSGSGAGFVGGAWSTVAAGVVVFYFLWGRDMTM